MITKAIINGLDIIERGWAVANFNLVEEMNLLDNTIVLPVVGLTIHDFDNALSPIAPESIFWGDDYSKFDITFYDDSDTLVYTGKIKDIKTLTDNKSVEMELENSSRLIFEQTLQYVRDVTDSYTPAMIIEDILVISGLKDLIYKNGSLVPTLARAIEYQQDRQYYIGATFSLEDAITINEALQKLALASGAYLYYTDLQLHCSLWEELSQIRRSSATFAEADFIEMPVINYDQNYITNWFAVEVGASDEPTQIITDPGFNNLGLESRNQYGQKELDRIELNQESSPIWTNATAAGITEPINAAEGYIKRFQTNLHYTEFQIKSSRHTRLRLNDFISLDVTQSDYDLSDVLFLITGISIDEDNDLTTIKAIESAA